MLCKYVVLACFKQADRQFSINNEETGKYGFNKQLLKVLSDYTRVKRVICCR